MIAAHDHDGGPAFELYALGLEHKHVAGDPEIRRAHPAADLRAVGRAFPPGDAGLGAAASRHAAGEALRRRSARRARRALSPAATMCAVVEPAADGKLEPQALNDTNKLELSVYANEARRQAVLVARLDNLGKGASGAAVQNLVADAGLRLTHAEPARSRRPARRCRSSGSAPGRCSMSAPTSGRASRCARWCGASSMPAAAMIDTSPMYGRSRGGVGDIVAELGLRARVFLATKVWISGRERGHRADGALGEPAAKRRSSI